MSRFQDGDSAAFEALYTRYRGPLYRYFVRQVVRSTVDDLFQEVWLRVIKGQARYRPEAPFAAYLYRIAHNVLVDYYRREGRAPEFISAEDLQLPDPGAGPERAFTEVELRATISRALTDLPAAQREAFLLHEEAGLTLEQIAAVVGTGRETIKSRLRYALHRLRRDLLEDEPADARQA
jgi:RNA polymerase sigma-70 factor (ECF subfamily)